MKCNYDQPEGWWCSRDRDHDGPCALRPTGPPFLVCEGCGAKTAIEPHDNPRYHTYDPHYWLEEDESI